MGRVTVVDYGMGNLFSVVRAIERAGGTPELVATGEGVLDAERLVLPGVGAFGDGMDELTARGLVEPLRTYAAAGRPLLGLCLGLHLLMDESEEFGHRHGLGILAGRVRALVRRDGAKVPHVGWAPLEPSGARSWDGSVLEALPPGTAFYFTHSFVVEPADAADVLAEARHGTSPFAAVLQRGPVGGTQFHPEKSGPAGLALLARFVSG